MFEYWTHAQSYLPVEDMRYFLRTMRGYSKRAVPWFNSVKDIDVRKVLSRIRRHGALSIRDIEDDELIEKDHAWASRKPSRRALHLAFFRGQLAISQRTGMLKTYDLIKRHFGWERMPAMASVRQVNEYLLERSLRSQGIVSLESICHLNAPAKPAVRRLIETRVRRGHLVPVQLPGANKWSHWVRPEDLEQAWHPDMQWVHILSPFDPLIIQRRRLQLFFGYEHRFEAYVPQSKRVFGYFACPVLIGDEVVAAIDMKTDRNRPALLIQKWTWVGHGSARTHKRLIEKALQAFEAFQLAR